MITSFPPVTTADTELTTADLDTGGGVDTRAVVGLVYAASGGAVLVSAANPLPVSAVQSGTWTVQAAQSGSWTVAATQSGTWSVTCNAGTNLNTSALALESGGNLATIAGAISGAKAQVNLAQYSGSAVGAGNAIHVQPGTGAAWAASQSGTWTVQAAQSGSWTVAATQSGTWTTQSAQSGTWTVQAAQSGSWTVAATQSGSWSVSVLGTVTVDSELTTADLDTGAGTDTRAVVGLVYAASGGATLVSASNPLPVSAAQSGSWTVAATQSGSWSVSQTGTWTVQAAQSGSWSVSVTGTATVDTELPAAAALADGAANPTTPLVGACGLRWNGATWDREQATQEGTLLASAARTSDTTSADQTNYTARGVMLFLRVSAGTPNLLLYIQIKDPVSGLYANANVAPTAITATGLYCYELSPGGTVAGQQVYQRTGGHLPRTWRVYIVHNNANSITYSVAYCYLV